MVRVPKPLTQRGVIISKKYKIMKKLIEILTNENKSFEDLPTWVWVIAAPAALVVMCMIGGTLS